MKRVFVSICYAVSNGAFRNETVEEIVNGLQERGGEIISFKLTPVFSNGASEHLTLFYEDNGFYEEIKEFLYKYEVVRCYTKYNLNGKLIQLKNELCVDELK